VAALAGMLPPSSNPMVSQMIDFLIK